MMPNPRTAAEWASTCFPEHWSYIGNLRLPSNKTLLCSDCADAYARQQVEAFRERAAQECEMVDPEKPTRYFYRREELPAAIRALGRNGG
mgnify:CR=1 FL=1